MSSSRKSSNGRSPLVNQQRQITAFFGKKPQSSPPSSSPSPSPALLKQNTNPSCSPSPVTPSPTQKKPLLVIGSNLPSSAPVSCKKLYGAEVVGRRIKVYWPLDKCWYEGCVKSFDKLSGKHSVEYDDGEEEMLNISEEKIEWIEEQGKSNKLRRLRKMAVVDEEDEVVEKLQVQELGKNKLRRLRKMAVVDDEEEEEEDFEKLEDDSEDEDWAKIAEKEAVEDEDCLEDMDLEMEEEEGEKCSARKKAETKKRKVDAENRGSTSSKKSKIAGEPKTGVIKTASGGIREKLNETTVNDMILVLPAKI